MIKLPLNNLYIRAIDERNWIIAKMVTSKKTGEEYEEMLHTGFMTLEKCFNFAIEVCLKKACISKEKLFDIYELLDRLDKVKAKHNIK